MQLLVVDDSAVDRHLLSSLLEGLGHQVNTCSTTDGVIEQISTGSYAALFLDIASLTQVLALNAMLVAARASEQRDPRQFLTVAYEFEAIADQISTLAQQTNDGLGSLQQSTAQIHSVVFAIDAEVQNLSGLVSEFASVLHSIEANGQR